MATRSLSSTTKCVLVAILLLSTITVEAKKKSNKIRRVSYKGKPSAFANYFANRNELLLISNAPSSNWPALEKWDLDVLANSEAGSKLVQVKRSPEPYVGWGCCADQSIPLRELCEIAKASEPEAVACEADMSADATEGSATSCKDTASTKSEANPAEFIYFTADATKTLGDTELLADIDPKAFNVSETKLKPGKASNEMDGGEDEENVFRQNLWIGSKGVIAPLHFDQMHNFFVQVSGRKRFTIFPPKAWRGLSVYPKYHLQHRNARLNPSLPRDELREKFPNYTEQIERMKITFEIGPGQVLYMPPLWFHQVEALTPSISVNMWSPSKHIGFIDDAWNNQIPIDFKRDRDEVVFLAATYVRDAIHTVLQQFRKSIVRSAPVDLAWALTHRFKDLYESGDVFQSLNVDVSPESAENVDYTKFRKSLEESPPFLDIPDDYDFAEVCKPTSQRSNKIVDNQTKGDMSAATLKLASKFTAHVDLDMVQMYLQYYLEDLVGQIMGEKQLYPFFRYCVAPYVPPAADIQSIF